jgi:choline dehydrogenase-like flavoprotein
MTPTSRKSRNFIYNQWHRILIEIPLNHQGGSVSIDSSNPFDAPLIDPNFFTTNFDIFALREAVKSARRFVTAPAWNGYTTGQFTGADATTDDEIDAFIRSTAGSTFHAVGTASMSPKGAPWGVVDPDLRVKGVVGLRIVDNSVVVGPVFLSPAGIHVYLFLFFSANCARCSYSGCRLRLRRTSGGFN